MTEDTYIERALVCLPETGLEVLALIKERGGHIRRLLRHSEHLYIDPSRVQLVLGGFALIDALGIGVFVARAAQILCDTG